MQISNELRAEMQFMYGGGLSSTGLCRSLGSQTLKIIYFDINNINLDYAYNPNTTPSEWWESGVVKYKTKPLTREATMTYTPQPDRTIDEDELTGLIRDEWQIHMDYGFLKQMEPADLGYSSETFKYRLKRAMLAIDIFKRYEHWGYRMRTMFKQVLPKHAEVFERSMYRFRSTGATSIALGVLQYMSDDVKSSEWLTDEKRLCWATLIKYVVDKEVIFSKFHNPDYLSTALDHQRNVYSRLIENGFANMVPASMPVDPETNYLSQFIHSARSNAGEMFFSAVSSMINANSSTTSEVLDTKERELASRASSLQNASEQMLKRNVIGMMAQITDNIKFYDESMLLLKVMTKERAGSPDFQTRLEKIFYNY